MIRGVRRGDAPSARVPRSQPVPLLRALVTGWLAVALAASAHRLGGCEAPGAVVMVVSAVAVAVLAAWIGRRRRASVGQSVSVMFGAQLLLHLVFEAGARAHHTATGVAGLPGGPRPGMVVNVAAVLLGTLGNLPRQFPMLAGHGVATLVLAWWLCAGERQLAMVVALGRQRLLAAYAMAAPRVFVERPGIRRLAWHHLAITAAQRSWATTVGRRGPPVALSPA